MTNYNRILYILIVLVLIISCKQDAYKALEEEAWEDLYTLKIEDAYPKFVTLFEHRRTEKNTLGLAYTQAVLDTGSFISTLSEGISDSRKEYSYGYAVAGFKYYVETGDDSVNFSMEEFIAFHEGGKFKIEKNYQIVEGEYRNLKPYGIWKFYSLDGQLKREWNYNENKKAM